MDEKDLSQLRGMIERLGPKDPPDRARANFDKWAGQVAECIERRDIIVIFNSQSGAGDDDEEDEAGIIILAVINKLSENNVLVLLVINCSLLANELLEVAILSALFKSARAKAAGIGNPRASLLHLAIIWDRFDIAKAQIFGDAATGDGSDWSRANYVRFYKMGNLAQNKLTLLNK